MSKIKVFIVDDAKVTRIGLAHLLNNSNEFEVIAEADNGSQFLAMLYSKFPDIVLMDINMPVLNGIDATKEAIKKYPELKIIALTNFDGEEFVEPMVSAGAKGFLMKDAEFSELRRAILTVSENGTYITPKLVSCLRKEVKSKEIVSNIHINTLEKKVLNLLSEGNALPHIAYLLKEDIETVEQNFLNLLKQTNTRNAVALVLFAFKNKMV